MARVSWDTTSCLVLLYRAGVGDVRTGTWRSGEIFQQVFNRSRIHTTCRCLVEYLDKELVQAGAQTGVEVLHTASHLTGRVTKSQDTSTCPPGPWPCTGWW